MFAAWVPVTDLATWHADSLARNNKYARETVATTSSTKPDSRGWKPSGGARQRPGTRSPTFRRYWSVPLPRWAS